MNVRQLIFIILATVPVLGQSPVGSSPDRVILDPIAVENLRLETVTAERGDFEETIFALGRIAVYPGMRAVVSSRIEGRALEVFLKHDHPIEKGEPAVVVESRQFADPPPTVTLPAPISGTVSVVNIALGEPVSPDRNLAEILDLTVVYALAQVPEHLAGRLVRGQIARISVPAVADRVFEAKLEHLGVLTNVESSTIEAAFRVENPDMLLRPGMRAEFSVVVDERRDVVRVPRDAIQGDPANRYVFVRDAALPGAFIKTPVVTGQANDRHVEIIRGVEEGDEVVARGAYALAFAGGGSLSLKEALDAAHGHEHNPDGSEIMDQEGHEHDHDHEAGRRGHSPFWMLVSAVLAVLLLVVSLRSKSNRA